MVVSTTPFVTKSTSVMTTIQPTISTSPFQAVTEAITDAVTDMASTTERYSTYSNELTDDDYYYYDYSELERLEEESNRKYQEQLAKLSGGIVRKTFTPTVYIGQQGHINESDLFVKDPKLWDPLQNFLDLVVAKVYMLIPAFILGVILGIVIWFLLLLANKQWSKVRKPREHLPLRGQEFHQIQEAIPVLPQNAAFNVDEKQADKIGPNNVRSIQVLARGSLSTSSGISSSSSTPVPFESASECGQPSIQQPSTSSSLRSRPDVPNVLRAVDNLAQSVETAIQASRLSFSSLHQNEQT